MNTMINTKTIVNDTTIHVAQFLQEPVGATRQCRILLATLPLDGELAARAVEAEVKLIRIPAGILSEGEATATVTSGCIRCLEEFEQPVAVTLADEYRPTIDILSGLAVPTSDLDEDEAEYFAITGSHLLDVRESLRQALVLGLPMAPRCREDCPGLAGELDGVGETGDSRLAVLGQLLGSEAPGPDRGDGVGATQQRIAQR